MKKRFFKTITVAILTVMLVAFMSIGCFATEEESATENVEQSEELTLNLWDRLSESLEGGQLMEVGMMLLQFALAILVFINNKASKTSSSKLLSAAAFSAKQSKDSGQETMSALAGVENVLAGLKLETSLLRAECEKKAVTAEQFNSVEEAIRHFSTIINTIYSHSSTIPAAIKEQIAAEYNKIIAEIDAAEASVGVTERD